MGSFLGLLPQHFIEKMTAEGRAEYAKAVGDPAAGKTWDELAAAAETKAEKTEQREFRSWLELKSIPFANPRTDKKSTIQNGHPDFAIYWQGRVLHLEFKVGRNRLSDDQKKYFDLLQKAGCTVLVIHSSKEAIEETKKFFAI